MPFLRVVFTGIAKLLSKVFSMATLTFFGRIPSKDAPKASFMGLLSLYWIYVLVSIVIPDLAEYFIPFLPDDDAIIRIISVAIAIVLPLVIGFTTTRLENRHPHRSNFKQTMMGYPYALILGILSSILLVLIPILKLPNILKRHVQEQFAIMIREGKYDDVMDEVICILENHDLDAEVQETQKSAWWTFMSLTYVMEHIFNHNIAKKMKYIMVETEEGGVTITLHATDISMIGPKQAVYYVKHILSEEIDAENLYFTWDHKIQKHEERIRVLKNRLADNQEVEMEEIQEISRNLRNTPMTNEDWNAVRRQIYKLERDHYRVRTEKLEEKLSKFS